MPGIKGEDGKVLVRALYSWKIDAHTGLEDELADTVFETYERTVR